MKMTPIAISILTLPLFTTTVLAQGDQMAMICQAAANQLGVLEYCKDQGAVDDAPVTAQHAVMAQLPAGTESTDADENLGKQGTLSVNGTTITLAKAATSRGITVADLCKQIGNSVVQGAAMLKQQQGATTPAQ